MLARLKRLKRGFTLVELMIVVAIIGVLAALAVYGVNRYITSSKGAEAKEMLGRIAKDAVIAYDREGMSGSVIAFGSTGSGTNHALCGDATAVPGSVPQGRKYQSQQSDWVTGSASAGWQCLKFSISGPQFFQYNYLSEGATGTFTALARGDLDGDGSASSISLRGVATTANGATFAPNFIEVNPEE